jgi:type II secretory pathway pseudopilin PulG
MSTFRRQRGFALVWALVMVAIFAALAAATMPILSSIADQQRVTQTAATLNTLDTGIIRFGLIVKRTAMVYPGALHQLSTLVTTTDQVSCQNATMTANSITTWSTVGPFVAFLVPTTGVVTPIGTIDDVIPTRVANGPLLLNMPNVDLNRAQMLDMLVDGSSTNQSTTGRILWGTVSAANTVTLQYSVGLQTGFIRLNQC